MEDLGFRIYSPGTGAGGHVGDVDAIRPAAQEGDGAREGVAQGAHPPDAFAAPHQVAHVAVGGVAHAVARPPVRAVHPHHVQAGPAE